MQRLGYVHGSVQPSSIIEPGNQPTLLVSAFDGRHACRNTSGARVNYQRASFQLSISFKVRALCNELPR